MYFSHNSTRETSFSIISVGLSLGKKTEKHLVVRTRFLACSFKLDASVGYFGYLKLCSFTPFEYLLGLSCLILLKWLHETVVSVSDYFGIPLSKFSKK